MNDEERLLSEYRHIKHHGQGKLTVNIGPTADDQTNILIEAGKTFRFIVPRYEKIIEKI